MFDLMSMADGWWLMRPLIVIVMVMVTRIMLTFDYCMGFNVVVWQRQFSGDACWIVFVWSLGIEKTFTLFKCTFLDLIQLWADREGVKGGGWLAGIQLVGNGLKPIKNTFVLYVVPTYINIYHNLRANANIFPSTNIFLQRREMNV